MNHHKNKNFACLSKNGAAVRLHIKKHSVFPLKQKNKKIKYTTSNDLQQGE
jgi:hypothetical protein